MTGRRERSDAKASSASEAALTLTPCPTTGWNRLPGERATAGAGVAVRPAARLALLTGRNHHSVGMGPVSDMATPAPGYTSKRPNTAATVAETLRLNGYSTAQVGKCHEAPTWEWSPVGPFDRWPTGGNGFEYFYGFIGGETSHLHPSLVEGTTPVVPRQSPEEGYHLTEDLAARARRWLSRQRALVPDKPFFLYFAPGGDPRADPRPGAVAGPLPRRARPRVGRGARRDVGPAEAVGRDPG